MNNKTNLREALRLAKERGWSNRAIAAKCGVSHNSVNRIMNGCGMNASTKNLIMANLEKILAGPQKPTVNSPYEVQILNRSIDNLSDAISMLLEIVQNQEQRIKLIEQQLSSSNIIEMKREAG